MDKKLVLAVAGSGKTTEIINKVNYDDKTIIITYTENNYNNIKFSLNRSYEITDNYITTNNGNINFDNINNKRPTNVIIGHIINFNGCRFTVTMV